ncbi:MAG TPA: orotidine 5'-phosphate decarboxylase, partial [Bacteroidales bacterium]|nr:orotidine 5'-phosphate decarboxylase [Bacteroidales bacterium]
ANDFQFIEDKEGKPLFEKVLTKSQEWGNKENLMFVCGATQASMFTRIRELAPESFLLVPGVGAQGGSLEEVSKYGMTKDCGLLVNSSRAIIFADKTKDFAKVAGKEAKKVQEEMAAYMNLYMK